MKPLLIPLLLLLLLTTACNRDDFAGMEILDGYHDNSTNTTPEEEEQTLSGTVIAELQANLTSASSSSRVHAAGKSSPPVNTTLSSAQITAIANAASKSVSQAGLESSTDLISLLPKIVEGSQGSLSALRLSSSETIKVIQVIVFSMTGSLNGRSSYLPTSSADNDSTPLETALAEVVQT